MTSRDDTYIIKQGMKFTALRDKQVQEFIAPDDLVAIYKGRMIQLEQDAGVKVLKDAQSNKTKAMVGGGIVSLLGIIYALIKKIKKEKK